MAVTKLSVASISSEATAEAVRYIATLFRRFIEWGMEVANDHGS
jgi:hypothetical protein